MTRIFLIVTIVLSMASAVLAYLTKEKAVELSGKLSAESAANTALKSDKAKLEKDKKKEADRVKELGEEVTKAKIQADALRAEAASKQSEVATLQKKTDEAAILMAKLKTQIEETPVSVAPARDPELEQKLAAMESEIKKRDQAATEEKAKLTQEMQQLKNKIAEAAKPKSADSSASGSQAANSKRPPSGYVVAYNEGWNFVVVNLGDKNGVTPDSKLAVFRDGKQIAKLKITEVQPSHTSAGLVYPDGRNRDAVQPGDLVVFSKTESPGTELSSGLGNPVP